MNDLAVGKLLFALAVCVIATGIVSPPLALASGIAMAMLLDHPFEKAARTWAKRLLQLSVIALGFEMQFRQVLRTGRSGLTYTAIGIGAAIVMGLLLGKWLAVRSKAAFLVSIGTAICGGSAIAAVAPITNPDEEELAMSLGTVFTLNSVALFVFPVIGVALHLTQNQFGLWSALAIHDTSSVVGAAAKFGPQALAVGTVVKLTRALWIVPVAFLTALLSKSKARIHFPWFILFFCLAALMRSTFTTLVPTFAILSLIGHVGLALTLFLIGTGITKRTVKQAGVRIMTQGVLLWLAVALSSLLAIRAGWIHV